MGGKEGIYVDEECAELAVAVARAAPIEQVVDPTFTIWMFRLLWVKVASARNKGGTVPLPALAIPQGDEGNLFVAKPRCRLQHPSIIALVGVLVGQQRSPLFTLPLSPSRNSVSDTRPAFRCRSLPFHPFTLLPSARNRNRTHGGSAFV